tara:strand:- start:1369 stop:3771 length:2403 start_codon:yes stop_codon:yes gene_type:complete
MGFWADNFGGGNSFTESVANVFTGSDGASYVGGELQYDKDPNTVGGGGAVAVNPDGGFGVNEDGTSEYSGSANDTNTTTAATANIVTGAAPEGLSNALGFVNPIGIIGKLAGWANGLDPKTQIGEIIDGKQTYTNAEGMMYTYNFLGLPYEIINKDGKILDKLAQKDENGKTGYEIKAEEQRVLGNNNDADAIIREGQNNAQASSGSATAGGGGTGGGGEYTSNQVLQMALDSGMASSNADIQKIIDDPQKWMSENGAMLSEKLASFNLDADTTGSNLDPSDPRYELGDDTGFTPTIADPNAVAMAENATNPGAVGYEANTTAGNLGTAATTVDPATGVVRPENLVTAEEIDLIGSATGTNADGTANVVGDALNDYASISISTMIDTSTVAGKLLADKLKREGTDFVDSKTSILWQMKTIAAEFKSETGDPIIPAWAQALSRDVAKTMAFSGITGTAATAAMSNAIMESMLGVAEKESTFYQTLTTKNLDNKQQSIINKANVLSKFEVANLDSRQAAAVQNAKAFLDIDMQNLTNAQQAEVINTQAMVDALFNDQSAINAQRLFGAEQANDMAKFYSNLNAQVNTHNSEQLNAMKRFNVSEINDANEYNSKLEQSRQEFYADMQYNLDLANAKWRQSVATANSEMAFEAHTTDVQNTLDLSTESMTRLWDRVDNILDYVFKGWNAEADRDAKILAATMAAQAQSSSGPSTSSGIISGLFTLGAAYITAGSDKRMKSNIEYVDTINSIKYYTWEWNDKAKAIGWEKYPTAGVIAQQVQKTHPKAVTVGPDGYLMVNYGELQ